MTFDPQSEACLRGLHPDLVSVVRKAREAVPFRVTEGMRSKERQKKLMAQGKSRTMNSRHLTGHAIDFVDMAGTYAEAEMLAIWRAFEAAGEDLGVALTWGGSWVKFQDTPHVELNWHEYPASSFAAKAKAAAGGFAVPAVPASYTAATGNLDGWKAAGDQVTAHGSWLISNPVKAAVVIGLALLLGWVVPRYVGTEEGE